MNQVDITVKTNRFAAVYLKPTKQIKLSEGGVFGKQLKATDVVILHS